MRHLYLIFISTILLGCIKEPEPGSGSNLDDFDRTQMLEDLSLNYIQPGYAEFQNKTLSFELDWNNFKSAPNSSNLETLRTSLIELGLAWQGVAFLEFGPAADIALRAQTNVFPIDTSLINSNISQSGYNLGSVSNFNAKGIQALDYLIFGEDSDNEQLSRLSNINDQQYVDDVINDMKNNISYIINAWSSFHTEFVDNSISNALGSAVSESSNAFISHYEGYIRKGKVGLPLGVFNGFSQAAMPGHVEGLYQDANLRYASEACKMSLRFLNGQSFDGEEDHLGLLDYCNYVDAIIDGEQLSSVINQQFNKVILLSNGVINPWSTEVSSNASNWSELYQEYQKIVPLLKVDLTSALGITVNYQDNDGD